MIAHRPAGQIKPKSGHASVGQHAGSYCSTDMHAILQLSTYVASRLSLPTGLVGFHSPSGAHRCDGIVDNETIGGLDEANILPEIGRCVLYIFGSESLPHFGFPLAPRVLSLHLAEWKEREDQMDKLYMIRSRLCRSHQECAGNM